jgi:hypothetical protein
MSEKQSEQKAEPVVKYVSKAGVDISPSRAGSHNPVACGKVLTKKQRAIAEQAIEESEIHNPENQEGAE